MLSDSTVTSAADQQHSIMNTDFEIDCDNLLTVGATAGAFLQATSRVPRWWIGERPPDMAASCDIYK